MTNATSTPPWLADPAAAARTISFLSRRLDHGTLTEAQQRALDLLVAAACQSTSGGCDWASEHPPSSTSAPRPAISSCADHAPMVTARHAETDSNALKRRRDDDGIDDGIDDGDGLTRQPKVRQQRVSIAVRGRTLTSRVLAGNATNLPPPPRAHRAEPQRLTAQ